MNNRVLVIDDDDQVIDTYREILTPTLGELDLLAEQMGLADLAEPHQHGFTIDLTSASQGKDGVELARAAFEAGTPFAVAMIDMRMPPGIDGLQTAQALREIDERILIVIVTAYTDRSVEEIQQVLSRDAMLVYKPFTGEEIFQMARTLCITWNERLEKQQAYDEIEHLASYPQENPAPVLRFSAAGELLYHNPYCDPVLEMMGISEVGERLIGVWLKRIASVYDEGSVLEIEVAGTNTFFLMTLVPIPQKGYINVYGQDITRRYLLNRQLTYQARHDPLTGLMNRRELVRKLNLLLRRVQDQGGEHAMLYLDFDHFREVNDVAGHLAGDRLLRDLSSSLLNEVKDGDVVARIGGDEFCMMAYNVTVEQARTIGHRICNVIKKHHFPWKGREFRLGVSVGITMINRENLSDADGVLDRADQACYAAKELSEELGQVYVHHTDHPVSEQQNEALALAAEVRSAVESGGFQLYLQPIQPVAGDRPACCHEVLLRMVSRAGEVVSPDAFIPSSERFDLMPLLDRWVIEETLKRIARQQDDQHSHYAINISGLSLVSEGLELFIRDQLLEHGVAPGCLTFELSEETASKQLTMVQQFIQEMHTLGAKVAIDDFGGEVTSFTTLQRLPVDRIKIESKLVQGVIHNKVERAIVDSMRRISAVLEMECAAIGVENPETVEVLQQIGIDYLQGYQIGKPELWA